MKHIAQSTNPMGFFPLQSWGLNLGEIELNYFHIFEAGSHSVALTDLKLGIILSQSPSSWDYQTLNILVTTIQCVKSPNDKPHY